MKSKVVQHKPRGLRQQVTHRHADNNNSNNGLPFFVNTTDYDEYGKITAKSDAGNPYNYNLTKFRLNNIENPQPAISPIEQNITYNSFKRPEVISEGDFELTYTYGPDQERIKGEWKENGQSYRTRIYASNFEINTENGISHEVCYISSPSGLTAMYVTQTSTGALTTTGTSGVFYYIYTDHLGSIISVTDASGAVIARQNFDAWGRRRNALNYGYLPNNTKTIHNGLTNLNSTNPNLPVWLFRGYTGHEMLNEFALINMNARLYDPVVGMMLSPDNYVSDATNTQDYNRYCYARNNPLKYSEPDGNEPVTMAIAASLGSVFGGVAGYKVGVARGATGLDLFFYTMAGAGIGAGAAVSGAWIGAASIEGGISAIAAAAVGGASGGTVSGAGFYTLGNAGTKNFSGEGITSATLRGAGVGAASGATGASVGGGIGAFLGGASGSIYSDALNHESINWSNALLSGAVSLGSYEIQFEAKYQQYDKNKEFGYLTRSGYRKISVATQRSSAWGKEAGAWIKNDGTVGKIHYGSSGAIKGFGSFYKEGDVSSFHTHPGNGNFQGPSWEDTRPTTNRCQMSYIIDINRNQTYNYNPNNTNFIPEGDYYLDYFYGSKSQFSVSAGNPFYLGLGINNYYNYFIR